MSLDKLFLLFELELSIEILLIFVLFLMLFNLLNILLIFEVLLEFSKELDDSKILRLDSLLCGLFLDLLLKIFISPSFKLYNELFFLSFNLFLE